MVTSLFAGVFPVRSVAQEKRNSSADWIVYGLLGIGLYELLKRHPHPSPTPSPVTPPTEAAGCSTKITDGWFEPAQGVWQDDLVFQDHPTKQLTRVDRNGPPAYHAELAMITERDTRFFGVKQYERNREAVATGGYYSVIHMAGTTDCDGPAKPVRMRFTVASGPHAQVVYTTNELTSIALTGKRTAARMWTADFKADEGAPAFPQPPYRFTSTGPYTITDELISPDGPTGLTVTVSGIAHPTVALRVGFLGVFLHHHETKGPGAELSDVGLLRYVQSVGRDAQTYIPDYYPLQTNGWVSRRYPHDLDLSAEPFVTATVAPASPPERTETQVSLDHWRQRERIEAAIAKELDLDTLLGGYDRLVAVVHTEDMNFLSPNSGGSAFSQKVVLVGSGDLANFLDVAHEIAHTLPWIWSSGQMKQQCTAPGNFHNTSERLASGIRIDTAGKPSSPDFLYAKVPFMGGEFRIDKQWIDQCTYWHLADELQKRPDPATILVRGGIGKFGNHVDAQLWPAYSMTGALTAPRGASAWSIILRDASGRVAQRYPFAPQFRDENGKPKDFSPFSFQLPMPRSLGSVELRGPGVSIVHNAGRFAPSVAITQARVAGSMLRLRWRIRADRATKPLSSVFVSNDGGSTYAAAFTERKADTAALPIGRGRYVVKVVVTDGTRSAQSVVKVKR